MQRWKLIVSLLATLAMVGCGGGGGSANAESRVYISGEMLLFGSSYTPHVKVTESDAYGSPYTGADVTINGQALAYDPAYSAYWISGTNITPDSEGKFNLAVTLNGFTYTASATAFTAVPTITFPATFTAASANTISWTEPVGTVGAISYSLYIYSPTPGAPSVYSSSTTTLSDVIPANTTTANSSYGLVVLALGPHSTIANAAAGSHFLCTSEALLSPFTAQ